MSSNRTSWPTSLLVLVLAGATLGVAAPAQAEDVAGCVATPAQPRCVFACPAYGIVKVSVTGPGQDGWVQGSIACGTPPGQSGYVKGTTVACREGPGTSTPWPWEPVVGPAWDLVTAPLDDGECSAQMSNPGDGPLGQCRLDAGARAVCSIVREGPLDA